LFFSPVMEITEKALPALRQSSRILRKVRKALPSLGTHFFLSFFLVSFSLFLCLLATGVLMYRSACLGVHRSGDVPPPCRTLTLRIFCSSFSPRSRWRCQVFPSGHFAHLFLLFGLLDNRWTRERTSLVMRSRACRPSANSKRTMSCPLFYRLASIFGPPTFFVSLFARSNVFTYRSGHTWPACAHDGTPCCIWASCAFALACHIAFLPPYCLLCTPGPSFRNWALLYPSGADAEGWPLALLRVPALSQPVHADGSLFFLSAFPSDGTTPLSSLAQDAETGSQEQRRPPIFDLFHTAPL